MRLLPTCREVTRLVLLGQDQQLPLRQKVLMRMHWAICEACTNFRGQLDFMKKAGARWRRYSESHSDE